MDAQKQTPPGRPKPAHVQEAIADLKREFISECLRIAAIKAGHGAANVAIGDDLNAERDIRLAIENLREAARAFRELVSPKQGANNEWSRSCQRLNRANQNGEGHPG
jgi:hypothetical protein